MSVVCDVHFLWDLKFPDELVPTEHIGRAAAADAGHGLAKVVIVDTANQIRQTLTPERLL